MQSIDCAEPWCRTILFILLSVPIAQPHFRYVHARDLFAADLSLRHEPTLAWPAYIVDIGTIDERSQVVCSEFIWYGTPSVLRSPYFAPSRFYAIQFWRRLQAMNASVLRPRSGRVLVG